MVLALESSDCLKYGSYSKNYFLMTLKKNAVCWTEMPLSSLLTAMLSIPGGKQIILDFEVTLKQ